MQLEARVIDMGIFVDVIDPLGVEERRAAFDAMHLIALFQQEFGKVGAILAGDTGDECGFCHVCFVLIQKMRERLWFSHVIAEMPTVLYRLSAANILDFYDFPQRDDILLPDRGSIVPLLDWSVL